LLIPGVGAVTGSRAGDEAMLDKARQSAEAGVTGLIFGRNICHRCDGGYGRSGLRVLAEEEFSSLLTRWEKEHPGVTVLRQVTYGTPRAALLEAAAGAQMLILGSRGRGGIRGMTLGSVTTVLVHHAPCPVGIVRLPAA